jgi:hypothetical protein
MPSIDEIARDVEQRAQNCRLDGDMVGAEIARRCKDRVRAAANADDAAAIVREFYGRASSPAPAPAAPRGCLGGLFGGLFGSSAAQMRPSYNAFGFNEGLAYSMFNGILRLGGSASWRNHNPGQIPYDDWAIENGAIGSDNGMAVFPSYQAGRQALAATLTSSTGNQSVNDLVRNSYLSNIPESAIQSAGIDPKTPAASLSPDQVNHLMDAVESSLGFDAGQAMTHESSSAPTWAADLFAADAAWSADSSISSDLSSSGDASADSVRSSDNS